MFPISPANPPTFGLNPVTELVTSPSAAQEEDFPFCMYPANPPARHSFATTSTFAMQLSKVLIVAESASPAYPTKPPIAHNPVTFPVTLQFV